MADGDGDGNGDARDSDLSSRLNPEEGFRAPVADEAPVQEPQAAAGAPIEQPQDLEKLDGYLLSQLEALDEAQNLLFKKTLLSGNFNSEVVDYLAQKRMWTQLVNYLKKCVVRNAGSSMVPKPEGASTEELFRIHAELLFSAYKAQLLDLIAYHVPGRVGVPRRYFDEHLLPLRESVAVMNRHWLRERFDHLNQIVDLAIPLPSLAESPEETSIEVKDYMFLYFPELRPLLEPIRGKAQSLVWRYGAKVSWDDGTRGFRCFSCHRVFRGSGVGHLRAHLEGGSRHQGRCPAVLPCTIESLALIPS